MIYFKNIIDVFYTVNTKTMDSKKAVTPLLPITDLLTSDVSTSVSEITKKVDFAVTSELKKVQDTEHEKIQKVLKDEITRLTETQTKNNDEIKKRVTELQSIRENNLVVAGAVSGLKKVLGDLSN